MASTLITADVDYLFLRRFARNYCLHQFADPVKTASHGT